MPSQEMVPNVLPMRSVVGLDSNSSTSANAMARTSAGKLEALKSTHCGGFGVIVPARLGSPVDNPTTMRLQRADNPNPTRNRGTMITTLRALLDSVQPKVHDRMRRLLYVWHDYYIGCTISLLASMG